MIIIITNSNIIIINLPILQLCSSRGNLSVLRAYSGLPGGFQ